MKFQVSQKGLVLNISNIQKYEARGSVVRDKSRYRNDGTIYGAKFQNFAGYGQAMHFDGVDDYVDCGNDASLDITGAITIEMWLKPKTTTGASGYIISKNDQSYNDNQYAIYTNNGQAQYLPTGSPTTSANAVPYNVWTHIAFTRTGGIGQFYINGETSGTPAACSMPSHPTFPVRIGCRWASGTGPFMIFYGLIAEVRIYNRALSVSEVKQNYYSSWIYKMQRGKCGER